MKLKFRPFRRAIQLASFFALNALIFNRAIAYLSLKPALLPLPLLSSINSPFSAAYGVYDVVQAAAALGEFPWLAIAVILITGSIVGRAFCGWACPIGLIQELVVEARGRKGRVSPRIHEAAKKLKFFVLGLTLLVSGTVGLSVRLNVWEGYRAALGSLSKGPFFPFSPDGIIFGTLPHLLSLAFLGRGYGAAGEPPLQLVAFKMFILGVFLAGAFSVPLFWCRYVCPVGALMGMLGKFSFLGLGRSLIKCEKCPDCVKACPMQIKILELPWEKFNHQECILCMECADACKHGAIRPKFP
ncbi:TPA: 4Fe-4S binding protein [Candidatus Bathyarchaeota archaeon]|nr:4Fe-4S binding protein [Candidatus Bathyarchaeota archaeon]